MAQWYTLKARDDLFTADMLTEAGYLAYVPREIVKRKLGRKDRPITRALLPGYIFVRCDEEAFSAVRAIGASDDFVRYTDPMGDRVPLRFQSADLAPVIWAEMFGDFDHTREPTVWAPERGDPVRVKAGLWKGYLGSIISIGRKTLVQLKGWKKEFGAEDLELVA